MVSISPILLMVFVILEFPRGAGKALSGRRRTLWPRVYFKQKRSPAH